MEQQDARIDELTGALTRAVFFPQLEQFLAAHTQLALCMIDLDHFKSVNDAFGHARGDAVLAEIGARLRSLLRHSDKLFRYGGDEFALLLPGSDERQAAALAERLLEAVSAAPVGGDPPLTLTLSIGVAALDEQTRVPDALFARADARLFEAKRRGRGMVVAGGAATPSQVRLEESGRVLERDAALAEIQRFYSLLPGQRRGVLTLAGPPGAGRSRLLAEAASAATLRGYTVLRPVGRAGRRTRLFGAWVEALAAVEEVIEQASGAEDLATRLLARLMAQPGAAHGLVVAVDDLAELDYGSIAVLEALLAAPAPLPIAVVAVAGSDGAARRGLEAPLTATIQAVPLSRRAIAMWLRGLLACEPAPRLVDWLAERGAGLPARIRALLEPLLDRGALIPTAIGLDFDPIRPPAETPEVAPPLRLPSFAGAFVGRIREVQRLKDLIEEPGLVTVSGAGGAGKTRLAVQAAAESTPVFSGGVIAVALAGVDAASRLPAAILAALPVAPDSRPDAQTALTAYLRDRRLLLLLDNMEHLLDGVSLLAVLLAAAPRLTILATSREPLRVPGERLLPLAGLAVPADAGHAAEAAQLLTQRAREAAPEWRPGPGELDAITRICRAVEGMPLGLELAAAWAPVLGLGALADALAQRFDLMEPATGTGMGAALSYFWSTLGADEQRILGVLAVFRGGFSAVAAREVANASLFLISALVDRAFVRREASGRYLMHELLRHFALKSLVGRPAEQRARARHASFFQAFAGQAARAWDGPEQGIWLDNLETEHDNLRAALTWTLEGPGDRHGGLSLVAHLSPFWWRRGHTEEGRRWSALALAALSSVDPALRVSVLEAAGMLAWNQSDYIQAHVHFEAALAIAREYHKRKSMAHLLGNLALLAQEQGEYGRALALGRESLASFRRLKDAQGVARALGNLGVVSDNLGQFVEAERYYREALDRFTALGNRRAVALSYTNLAGVATRDPARLDEALYLLEQALAGFRALGDARGVAFTMYDLAQALRMKERPELLPRAAALIAESLKLEQEVGNIRAVHICLYGMAGLAAQRGAWASAMRLLGAEEALRMAVGAARPPSDQDEYVQGLAHVRAALGEEAAAAAWAAGQALTLDEAVAFALELAAEISAEPVQEESV